MLKRIHSFNCRNLGLNNRLLGFFVRNEKHEITDREKEKGNSPKKKVFKMERQD